METKLQHLILAEENANLLFQEIEKRNIIHAGKSEKILNQAIYDLAFELFGIKKYWHKRIVRAGKNTLLPYRENPPNLVLQEDDILFLDFGPVFEEWEADFGRTYVLGENIEKLKLKQDAENAWQEGSEFYKKYHKTITGKDFYDFTCQLAHKYNWEYGNEHCGHLIGNFPHEKLLGEDLTNYIHPENTEKMATKDKFGNERFWIYEIHFVHLENEIGAFHEQLLKI